MHVLFVGTLLRDPTEKISKNGKVYASALLRTGDGDAALLVNVMAFGDDVGALLSLTRGDALSIQGKADIGVYVAKDGQHRPSLAIMATALTPLRRNKPRPGAETAREPDTQPRQQRLAGKWTGPSDGPNDEISFGEPR